MTPAEALEPFAIQIVNKLMSLVKVENEENAILCMKIIMDLLRNQKQVLADLVQPFLGLIQELFQMMEQAVRDTFDNPTQGTSSVHPSTPGPANFASPRPGSPASSGVDIGNEQHQTRHLLKGMQSFKVLAECPIIVVSLFQVHRTCVAKNVKAFVPLIKKVLLLQAKPQEKAYQEAKTQGKLLIGVCKDIKNRAAFGDFITAQVKTLSFLAYLLRIYAEELKDFLTLLPDIVVRLLRDCPREKYSARKELLVAIRHIVNFNFRKIFRPKIDELLDERILIGDGLTVYETMRPLAYSILADLIHHLRESLERDQIRRTIEVYTKNLHDNYPGTSFQTMSAKLLMNMAECIARLEPKKEARYYLVMILNAIGDKFAALNRQYKNAIKLSDHYSQQSIDAVPEDFMADKSKPLDWDEVDIFNASPIRVSNSRERTSDPITDNKFLFKTLLHGLKNLFYQLRSTNPIEIKEEIDATNAPANWQEVSFGYNAEEVKVLVKLFREGARVFRYYGVEKRNSNTQHLSQVELLGNQHMTSGKEEKDLLEQFANFFHHIDPATFHEIFQSEIPHLYEMMFEHAALLHVPQFLLASEATSPSFAGMLLQFLMSKIEEVGKADTQRSSILLRLFKLSFMAVTLFAHQNEQVLLPHVTKIITQCIQLSTTAEEPMNYFLLLRSLFRSIGGGRFELLYKEILPLLEMLLEVLNNLLLSARKTQERDLFVELTLTVPARLSNLLPHLSFLMRPLVVALRAGSDLVGQGLRTLELCVDNLNADYLDPIIAPVIDDLMTALWEHLKPNPYSHFHAHTTMRILGKLAGRNRKFLTGPPEVHYKAYADDRSSFDIRLVGSMKDRAFPAEVGIDEAIAKLVEVPKLPARIKSDAFYKSQAYRLICAHTKMLIGFDKLPDDFAQILRLQANDLHKSRLDAGMEPPSVHGRDKSIVKKHEQQTTLRKLLRACFFATSIQSLRSEASSLLADLSNHFAVLEINRGLWQSKYSQRNFDIRNGEGLLAIDSTVFTDAIGDSLASDDIFIREAAQNSLTNACEAAVLIFGSPDMLSVFPLINAVSRTFIHNCYKTEWFIKSSGAIGIEILLTKLSLPDEWVLERQYEITRALMYVIKDIPQDLSAKARNRAQETLEILIRRLVSNAKTDDVQNPKSKLMEFCASIVVELAHMNNHVRRAAQNCFEIITKALDVETHQLITPFKASLLTPIFNKPLRALPFNIQIGYINAVTYCLITQPSILDPKDPLTRLFMECLTLAEADDENLTTKPHEQRNAEAIAYLRVSCIRLLSTTQGLPGFGTEFGNSAQHPRERMIATFFRSLYSKSPEVVEAANDALQGVLSGATKLPKDILQSGLRPILMNLQDPRKLSVEGLGGLARLLKLLVSYFKIEIGNRLLDHMRVIVDRQTLQRISFTGIEQSRHIKIITATFNVFHLLPPAAVAFLKPLIQRTIEFEKVLRRTTNSPFREPLIKYLIQYPNETWDYFAPLLKTHEYGRLFAQIMEHPLSTPLKNRVAQDIPGLVKSFSGENDDEKCPAIINAIQIVAAISSEKDHKFLLSHNKPLRSALFESGLALQKKLKQNEVSLSYKLAAGQACELLFQTLVSCMDEERMDLDLFFEVIEAVTSEQIKAYPVIFNFIYRRMVCSPSVEFQRSLIMRCVEHYTVRSLNQEMKTFVFRYLVNPILLMDIKINWEHLFGNAKGTKLMDKSLTEVFHSRLWRPQLNSDMSEEINQPGVDHSRLELLQMTAILIKYHHNLIQEARKDIIKFGWNYIRLEDTVNKHAAYVLIAYFIAQYETPAKIAIQVYQTVLKAHQNEGKSLVMQALEILAPVLRKRISGGDVKTPLWARIPRKILLEESSNLQQLLSIYSYVVRYPNLFYEAREHFTQVIIPSLNKIAQLPNPSTEGKKLVLNLIELVWKWEEGSINEARDGNAPIDSPKSTKRKADGMPTSPTSKTSFIATPTLRVVLIKYLMQYIATLPDKYLVSVQSRDTLPVQVIQASDLCRKAIRLLYSLLSEPFWTDLDVDESFFKLSESILTSEPKPDDKAGLWITQVTNTLRIVRVMVDVKTESWISDHLQRLQKVCEKPLKSSNIEIQNCLYENEEKGESTNLDMQPLVGRLLKAAPDPVNDDDESMEDSTQSDLFTFCSGIISEALSNGNLVAGLNLLEAVSERRPSEVDTHIPVVMKALQTKLTKEHIAACTPGVRQNEAANSPDVLDFDLQVTMILKAIKVLSCRMSQLGENRRPFLTVLASLVERSTSNKLCLKILELVERWIFHSTEPLPSLKEKTAVLHKMLLFEHRADSTLLTKFLELVIRIYEDAKVTRSELTVRMEHAFLIGTRAQDVDMRNRFMTIFHRSLSCTASSRLNYVIASQNWDCLADSYWLSQVIQLMLGCVEFANEAQLHPEDFKAPSPAVVFGTYAKDNRLTDVMVDDKLETFTTKYKQFCAVLNDVKASDILEPLSHLQHADSHLAHQIWVAFFPLLWSALSKDDRIDLEKGMVSLLTKDYHQRQIDKRPNCVQTLLEGIVHAKPRFRIPPHVMKFMARTSNAWYTAACYLEEAAIHPIIDSPTIRESNLDALVEIYATLQEDDLFYGTWRRRCQFVETNAALSYEQHGMWDKAQLMYESAQIKARTGALPYSQGEYMLWEDHWVICAQKLQQWEILSDFAKHENFNDLYLESTWRNFEAWSDNEEREQIDSIIKAVSDAPTPRRIFFQAFMSLLKLHAEQETPQEFNRICDEAIQLSIRKWHQLPNRITQAHLPILQNFQQLVELHDASVISASLSQTTQANLDQKSQELKNLLSTWRDRMPNFWDDINTWQDLVTWRQHIFQLINGTYLHLVPPQQGNASTNSYAYRGYHETAWLINRFAHVARKHNLQEVCITQLSRIYTLPNIEIQEAFLKLREQAKCHYQNKNEYSNGLDVINNTNLNYFGQQQKAEFYTLKGMFLFKLGQKLEANDALGSALYFDIRLPKAWAEWGRYNDILFKEENGIDKAASAISCYLEAAGRYKSAKSRKLISRVLWLLSLDDGNGTLGRAFTDFKGEFPTWYWITFIPQLLSGLSQPEAPLMKSVLMKLAKAYPQALYFQLRTSREDMHAIRKQQESREAREKAAKQKKQDSPQANQASPLKHESPGKQGSPESRPHTASGSHSRPGTANGAPSLTYTGPDGTKGVIKQEGTNAMTQPTAEITPKKPWDHLEEIITGLKTAYPLLALSMETMVDQIQKHFKCPPDEDAYRLIVALLNDGLSYVGRSPNNVGPEVKLPPSTEANISRFAESILPVHIRRAFEADFVTNKPTMLEYIQRLRRWRDRLAEKLDRRPPTKELESYSAHLSEFRFQKFDEVEVPGQYLLHRDHNKDFVRIERFLSDVDVVRSVVTAYRRIKIRGHDGSIHTFAIQSPAARHCRREERVLQLFRMFNVTLSKRKESRRRNLQFFLPLMIPLSPSVRLVQDDASYVTLQGIYEDYCRRSGLAKDDPLLFTMEKLRALSPVSYLVVLNHYSWLTSDFSRKTPSKSTRFDLKRSQLSKRNMFPQRLRLNTPGLPSQSSKTSGSFAERSPTTYQHSLS